MWIVLHVPLIKGVENRQTFRRVREENVRMAWGHFLDVRSSERSPLSHSALLTFKYFSVPHYCFLYGNCVLQPLDQLLTTYGLPQHAKILIYNGGSSSGPACIDPQHIAKVEAVNH